MRIFTCGPDGMIPISPRPRAAGQSLSRKRHMDMISFVILTWNSRATIGDCLERIGVVCTSQGIDFEVHVVDNGSSDGTPDIVGQSAGRLPISFIRLPDNRGTTRPRNMALRDCRGNVICIMDSDAALLDGDLRALLSTLRGDPSIGILAPKLLTTDGTVQTSVRKFPSMLGKLRRIPAIVLRRKLPGDDLYPDFPFDTVTEVDYAISACWFLRRDILDSVGYLDERIFYSPEDVDYCIRIWKSSRKIVYYPFFTVLHHVQQITHRNFLSRIAASHLLGLLYYFLKHRYVRRPHIPGRAP
jgi:GT2 family glycosyltransferase